tara:strand:+ start:1011 stop:1262 length:252 start_codon:yes stop_codon:yes gene_type:complete
MKTLIRKILKEFNIELLNRIPYKDGELALEYVEGYDYPRYVIYYEVGDLEDGDTESNIVAELDSRYFDAQMAQTIMEYIKTRE